MKTFRLVFMLLGTFVVALAAYAQDQAPNLGMNQWWNDRPIVKNLGLNNDQMKQIQAVRRESRDRLIELRAALQKAEASLRDEMNEEKVDMGRAEAAIEKVVAARTELIRAVSKMSLKLRMVLTPAQWHELEMRTTRMTKAAAKAAAGRGAGRNAGRGANRRQFN